jgi:mannosyltransferase OCH1-like enzyme
MIPKIIHILCRNVEAPGHHVDRVKVLHPGWIISLYDDTVMELVVRTLFPENSETYFTFPLKIQQRDIFRMLVTGWEGGFYMDADIHCMRALDDLLSHELVLAEEKTLNKLEMQLPHHHHPLRIANYMFGCIPRHPFIQAFTEAALKNRNMPVLCENDVLETTGPGFLTNFYHKHKHLFNDILLLSNPDLYCPKKCCSQPSCHFGNYATHLHEGSWRWQ